MKHPIVKTVMITGATSGIGRATAVLFAKKGYNLIITGRRKERLHELKLKLHKKYAIKVKELSFDVRDKSQCKKTLAKLDSHWKKIDILINNAGLASGLDRHQH